MNRDYRALCMICLAFPLALACNDDSSAEGSGTNSTDSTAGDGDGDPAVETGDASGDGDGTPTGDGDGAPTGDGDGSPGECIDGEEQCKVDDHEICVGGVWQPDPCPADSFCDEQTDTCVSCVCTPGEQAACANNNEIETCAEDCSGFVPTPCNNGVCIDGSCVDLVCVPGEIGCADADTLQICNDNGTAWNPGDDCGPGDQCAAGQCITACEIAAGIKSNIGCEFWAVDMSNLPPRDKFTYAVTVSNPSFDFPATVRIYDKRNGAETLLIEDVVAPRDVGVFNISGSHAGFTSYYNGIDSGFLGNGIGQGNAFRIETDQPVLATQFNPIGGASGFTTDASLLLPTHTLGLNYIHLDWDRGFGDGAALNIVATEDNTTVTVIPTVNTAAGANGLPAMAAGVPTDVVLDAYDYIQIGVNDLNLTGSDIVSDKPVAVFGGHACANVPTESTTACDHVEEQIFPLETWGLNYVAARNPQRVNEPMRWRIVASEDNTTITFDPPQSIGAQTVLNANEFVQFDSQQDFYISADDPILVAGYMHGGSVGGGQGDPYMVLMVPVEQYQDDYVFLVDSSYTSDFAKLVRPTGSQVTVDCLGVVPENRWTTIGNSGWQHATINMNPGEAMCDTGTNAANGAQAFGIIISGQASYASYGYPGGLALEEINPQ